MSLTIVEVSKTALEHNLAQLKALAPPAFTLMPVIKSNAYGHGMLGVAEAIRTDVAYMVVASIEEGLELRRNGIDRKLLILGNVDCEDEGLLKEAIEKDLELSVYNTEMLYALQVAADQMNCTARIHIKVDTGMRRFGVLETQACEFVNIADKTPAIAIQGIFSHLAAADEAGSFTERQEAEFRKLLNQLKAQDISIPMEHLYNSAGSMRENLLGNACRIGISLYGLYPSMFIQKQIEARHPEFSLQAALTWKTRIVQVKQVPEGSAVSYGFTYFAEHDEILAVLPIGYDDGYDRGFSNSADVLIQGKRCPVIGRVCMNQTVVNVSDIPEVHVGDEVVLLGKAGDEYISAEELAKKIDTINYEIVTRINPLLPRVLV